MNYFTNILFIIFFSPQLILFFLIVSMLIFLFDGSPIFFKQKRIGKDKFFFTLYKFRTMRIDKKNLSFDKKRDYSRITFLGYFLRKFSLDEIPEFYNILRNEMSVVGPRPLPIEYIDHFKDDHLRHSLLPGLTGLSQIKGRNSLTWKERFELDNYYIKNRSLILDLKIILKTIYLFVSLKAVIKDKDLTSTKLDRFDK